MADAVIVVVVAAVRHSSSWLPCACVCVYGDMIRSTYILSTGGIVGTALCALACLSLYLSGSFFFILRLQWGAHVSCFILWCASRVSISIVYFCRSSWKTRELAGVPYI
uniref:Uncharacterized protein n=1 Tax=Anopheles darlingi TaxID=43151 RepID=A0A2M4D3P2_ANODA